MGLSQVALRNSRQLDGAEVFCARAELDAWVRGVKAGEFDDFG